jgi:hypothetical protein
MNTVKPEYHPNRSKVTQLFVAGFFATLAMLMVGFLLSVANVDTDFARLMGTLSWGATPVEVFSSGWWVGLVWHFFNGTVLFSLLFDFFADRQYLTSMRWVKGAVWGVALWLFFEGVVRPLAGQGFFSNVTGNPWGTVVGSLLAWSAYGFVLESMTRLRVVHELHLAHPRRAA